MIFKDIFHQIILPFPMPPSAEIQIYLVENPDTNKLSLIDCGPLYEPAISALKECFQDQGFHLKDVNSIVGTHSHVDHFGAIEKIKAMTLAKVALHEEEIAFKKSMYSGDGRHWTGRFQADGMPERLIRGTVSYLSKYTELESWSEVTIDQILYGGERLDTCPFLEVIWTPGHAPGHVCLFSKEYETLFCGDHLLMEISPHVGLGSHHESSLEDYLEALEKVKALNASLGLPGHGPVILNPGKRAQEIIEHHNERAENILECLEGDLNTPYEISGQVFGDLPLSQVPLAFMETVQHLRLLESRGQVLREQKRGKNYYKASNS